MVFRTRDYNESLHWMAIPLRSIATSELGRYVWKERGRY